LTEKNRKCLFYDSCLTVINCHNICVPRFEWKLLWFMI
jgi:hypothetical protein